VTKTASNFQKNFCTQSEVIFEHFLLKEQFHDILDPRFLSSALIKGLNPFRIYIKFEFAKKIEIFYMPVVSITHMHGACGVIDTACKMNFKKGK
jgi:hypothetical protein